MDHVEVLQQVLTQWRERATDNRKKAFRSEHDVTKSDTLDDCADELQDAITALSAKPEGGSGVSDKRGDHAEALAGLLAAGGADPLSQSERAALKAAIGILCADPPRSHGVVVDEAMIDAYLSAQAKAVQAVDDKWGGGGKAASYLHPVREACRAGLQAALAAAPPAPSAGLDDLAKFIATNYPMAAIIRALDRAAPGIRHAFSPPCAARIWPQAGGKVES